MGFDIEHLWPRPNPACDLSQFPTDLHHFTPEQREAMVKLLSEQPVWWLREKRASIPHLGEKSVQRMAKAVVDEAIARAGDAAEMNAALAKKPDVLSWRVFEDGYKLEIVMKNKGATIRHEERIQRLLNSLGWRLWATGDTGYVLKRM